MKNILLAVNFEEESSILLEKTSEIAKKFNAKVWIIHIAEPEADFIGYDIGPQYIREFKANDYKREHHILKQYVDQLEKQGVNAEGLLIQGYTINMIIKESIKLNTDLIIMGHHEHSKLYNIFVGNINSEIIKHAKVPVLIIPLLEK